MQSSAPIASNFDFEQHYRKKIRALLASDPITRGAAHAMKDDTTSSTHELMHVTDVFKVDLYPEAWQEVIKPNLPWAEDHFQERVSGEPLNPAPSEAWWPFARKNNEEHKKDEKFSHTYPERYWPTHAGNRPSPLTGIRFRYGDLSDVTKILSSNPYSRQAYLPVWFPEDLTAARLGERVPCSMGYHFIYNPLTAGLDCVYTMRSCDIVRFYRDDVYMAGRLLQWVCTAVGHAPGNLVVHLDNLHCFPGDRPFLEAYLPKEPREDQFGRHPRPPAGDRANYNFDAL